MKIVARRVLFWLLLTVIYSGAVWAAGGGGGGGSGGGGGGGSGGVLGGRGGPRPLAPDWLIALILFAFACFTIWALLSNRRHLVTVAVVLRKGNSYSRKLRHLINNADFSTLRGRYEALDELLKTLRSNDICDGYAVVVQPEGFPASVERRAYSLWRDQMSAADISPSTVNVSAPHTQIHFDQEPERKAKTAEGVCIVEIIVAVRSGFYWPEGGIAEARKALRCLQNLAPDALYFFYTPDNSEYLSSPDAQKVLEKLHINAVTLR